MNPLLQEGFRIPFHLIRADHVEPGIREALARAQQDIDHLAQDPAEPTWGGLIAPLDELTRWVSERITPASHLMGVAETPELRQAYNAVLPEIAGFWTRLGLNRPLWERIKAYAGSQEGRSLEGIHERHLAKTLLEFRRAGAELPKEKRKRLEALRVELAQLEQKFSENVLDATAAWELHVSDPARLEGVPVAARERYRAHANGKGLEGWLLSLDQPALEPILKYAKDRELRRELFVAHTTRCRDGEWDNRALVVQILALRHELALLLGYGGFPDYRLEDHMAKTGERALRFEHDMVDLTLPYWERDVEALRDHGHALALDRLRPWDVAWVREDLRRKKYEVDDEMLRPYFPLDAVMQGLFEILKRVFGLVVTEEPTEDVWHPDVRYYRIEADDGTWLGGFYTDWFPRKEKRQGAWMGEFITGGPKEDGGFAPHLGVICGNFTPPQRANEGAQERPSLLTHREVQTIFHECGHLLHHCTSRVPVRARSGLNVAWDWVELPSQFMENWTWERDALEIFARHFQTGDPVPEELFQRLVAAQRFMGGWAQMRQLSFGSVDLELHADLSPRAAHIGPDQVMAFAKERFLRFAPDPEFADYHVLTAFSHLFSGGYAAGYYSYLWSEVLDADAFTRFQAEGIFNRSTGKDYLAAILSRGDSADPEELFREFMGRDPDPTALLERNLGPLPDSVAA